MSLHNINYSDFDIIHGDTLLEPAHWEEEPFEVIASNPPYSIRWEGNSNPLLINDKRFAPAGLLARKAMADLAFAMHMLRFLAVNGTAAIVEFPGVLYWSGAERRIREYLIDNNFMEAVIQLSPDLSLGTTIAACITVLKKAKKDNSVLFVDGSALFKWVGNKNRLLKEHQNKILDAFTARKDEEYFATRVANEQIGENEYNLSVSRYMEAYSWGAGEDEPGDGLYCGFEGVVRAAVISVENTPSFDIRDDTLNEITDTVDGRVVSPVAVGEFTMGGFLRGGDHSQSDIALVPNMHRGIKCLEESGFLDGLRIMHTAC